MRSISFQETTLCLVLALSTTGHVVTARNLFSSFSLRGRKAIVNGEDVVDGEYPGFAFNKYGANKGCGATLIHKDILLTAAHCRTVFEGRGAYVGATQLVAGKDGQVLNGEFHEDDGVLVHEDYDSNTEANNIMLVKLLTTTDITPVKLNISPDKPLNTHDVDVIGFGDMEQGGDLAETLQKATLSVVPTDECIADYEGVAEISAQKDLCAFHDDRDTCSNDSGGPLFRAGRQVGITSYGKGCAMDHPTVFVRVSAYDDWIQEGICSLSSDPPATCGGTPGEVVNFSSFVAFNTNGETEPRANEFVRIARVTMDSFKECYEEKFDERLFALTYNIDSFESGQVYEGRPSLDEDYNVYVQFSNVEAVQYSGSVAKLSQHTLKEVFADCINKDFVLDDIRPLGGAFKATKEVLFKTPVGEDLVVYSD